MSEEDDVKFGFDSEILICMKVQKQRSGSILNLSAPGNNNNINYDPIGTPKYLLVHHLPV